MGSLLARFEDNPSPCDDKVNGNETEIPPLEEVPMGEEEGACAPLNEDEAYIAALEPQKFDTAELVVRLLINNLSRIAVQSMCLISQVIW